MAPAVELSFGPVPTLGQRLTCKAPPGAYDLGNIAQDSVGLLDHLGIGRAHVVGMSRDDMIAQTMAARTPNRVDSLTSIFSTTGARSVG